MKYDDRVSLHPSYRIAREGEEVAFWGRLGEGVSWAAGLATYGTLCGNGAVDDGEACDSGEAGDTCCTNSCQLVAKGTVCRGAVDTCDVEERCDGESTVCPEDQAAPPIPAGRKSLRVVN